MTANRGLFVPINTTGNVGTTELEARLALAQLFEHNAAGVPRSGLLLQAGASGTVVTGSASNMSYNLSAIGVVQNRAANDGVYLFDTTGTTNVVTTAAPATNSRIDLLWVRQNDKSKGDPDNLAVFGVTQGASATTPTAPALPTRAMEVARATVTAGQTTSSQAAITQTFKYAALKGAVIPVRDVTDRGTITAPTLGQRVKRLDVVSSLDAIETWNGTAWTFPFAYVEFNSSAWNISGGQAQWDIGPMVVDGSKQWNNDFTSTAGVPSGSVTVTKAGLYTVSALVAPAGNPGSSSLLLRDNTLGSALATGSTQGQVWEYSASFTRYLPANTNIRGVCYQANSTTAAANMTLTRWQGVW